MDKQPGTQPGKQPERIAVIGVGLIGGSFALAMKAALKTVHVVGYDRDEINLAAARHMGVVDSVAHDPESAVRNADVVMLAVPVGQFDDVLPLIVPGLSPTAVLTDAGSTKSSVVASARKHLGKAFERYVPGHPIAGAEHSGVRAARVDLFKGRDVILTPVPETHPLPCDIVRKCWEACGARVEEMSTEQHDAIFGVVSHLPHLLSYALVHDIATRTDADVFFRFAASGFRDFTRIAASSPEMWTDISVANRELLLLELERYQEQLRLLALFLREENTEALWAYFKLARDARRAWMESN